MIRFFIALLVPLLFSCSSKGDKELSSDVPTFTTSSGKKVWTGLKIPANYKPDKKHYRKIPQLPGLPSSFDWRQQTALHPVRDQGNCGSCWAMASTSVFEDTLRIKSKVTRDVAEQFPLSCSKSLLGEDWSCNGGFYAYDIFKSPWGAVNESDFPYTASDSACKSGLKYYEKIISWANIDPDNPLPDTGAIKSAMFMYGPIGVAVAVDNDFSAYSGGIHKKCNATPDKVGLNHAVVLVGWNDADGGYWIMRNSWGTGWGENGFMKIPYGCDQIGSWANYVIVDENPEPNPSPDPEPNPSPDPTPTPTPEPCSPEPKADIGKPDVITVRKGSIVNLGTKPLAGHSYVWTASPPFDNGAKPTVAQIRYQPRIQKTLTLTATTKCGSASDSVTVKLQGSAFFAPLKSDTLH